MGVGRFICVGLPFGLTFASLVCILITMFAGISNKNLDMFKVETQNFSISTSALQNFEDLVSKRHLSGLTSAALTNAAAAAASGTNITAADLGLADSYKVYLWNYCATTGTNTTCTKAKFNWAASELNTTSLISATGVNVTLPAELRDSLKTFTAVSKWTQVVFIVAIVATAVELIAGIFGFFSRAGSCCTFIISSISGTAIVAAAAMATALSAVVVGAVKSTAKAYGAEASLDYSFLGVVWLAVAFSVAGALFWLFSICCCASAHQQRGRNIGGEKMMIGRNRAYQQVDGSNAFDSNTSYGPQTHGIATPQRPVKAGSYEPYSHGAV